MKLWILALALLFFCGCTHYEHAAATSLQEKATRTQRNCDDWQSATAHLDLSKPEVAQAVQAVAGSLGELNNASKQLSIHANTSDEKAMGNDLPLCYTNCNNALAALSNVAPVLHAKLPAEEQDVMRYVRALYTSLQEQRLYFVYAMGSQGIPVPGVQP